jgi:hypothetical protein
LATTDVCRNHGSHGPARDAFSHRGVDDAELRVELVAMHLMGLAFASAPIDDLVAFVGPTVQRYLTEPTTP